MNFPTKQQVSHFFSSKVSYIFLGSLGGWGYQISLQNVWIGIIYERNFLISSDSYLYGLCQMHIKQS